MRPLRYSINVTLDGCCDHHAIPSDEELHRHPDQTRDDEKAQPVRMANVAEIVTALAVIVSLIFVGYEIRQNTEATRAATMLEMSSQEE